LYLFLKDHQSRGSSIVVLVAAATVDTDLQNQPSRQRLTDRCADGPGFEKPGLVHTVAAAPDKAGACSGDTLAIVVMLAPEAQ